MPKKMNTIKYDQLEMKIENGRFVITAGIELVCHAVMYGLEPSMLPRFDVINKEVFANEILQALKAEEEDGTNLIHRAFDAAAIQAIENGAEGVRMKDEVV